MAPPSLSLAQAQAQSRALYRRILRTTRPLTPDTREYYRRIARSSQGFARHGDETDPARIYRIIGRVEQDLHWVRSKHSL